MIVQYGIIPRGKGGFLAGGVAKIIDVIDSNGLPCKLTAMGAIVEGEWGDVMALIGECP